jgi:hypothetical protein
MEVEIDQGEVCAQRRWFLAIPRYLTFEAEDPLQDAERMFHLGPHAGLAPVLLAL